MSDPQNPTCPRCQASNRAEANFCKNCGTLLSQRCPRCGNALPEAANFCDHCGLRLVDPAGFNWWQTASKELTPAPASVVASALAARSVPAPASIAPSPAQAIQAAPAPSSASPTPKPSLDAQLQQFIPKELLAKLEAARTRGEMVGERRVVTMLFCDAIGSTAAAEQLDPEEWSEIINGAFEHMIRPVYTY